MIETLPTPDRDKREYARDVLELLVIRESRIEDYQFKEIRDE